MRGNLPHSPYAGEMQIHRVRSEKQQTGCRKRGLKNARTVESVVVDGFHNETIGLKV